MKGIRRTTGISPTPIASGLRAAPGRLATLPGLLPLLLLPAGAHADALTDTVKPFHPYVELSAGDNSNLFATPQAHSDRYAYAEAGFDAEMNVSRQTVDLGARVNRIDYDRYSGFDYTGGEAHALWNWAAGPRWDGRLGYRYDKKQRDFDLMETPRKDLRERRTLSGTAGHWLTERWRVVLGAERTDVAFSSSTEIDARRTGGSAEVDYVTTAGNSVGVRAEYAKTHYENVAGRDYDDLTAGPTARWQVTGKLKVQAQAGYTRRSHAQTSGADFSGATTRVTADWQATAKTAVSAKVWREVTNLQDQIPNYAVVSGVSVAPTWNITDKTALAVEAGYEKREFQRLPVTVSGDLGPRTDDVSWAGARIDWRPREQVRVSLSGHLERRDSGDPAAKYDRHVVELQVRIGI